MVQELPSVLMSAAAYCLMKRGARSDLEDFRQKSDQSQLLSIHCHGQLKPNAARKPIIVTNAADIGYLGYA